MNCFFEKIIPVTATSFIHTSLLCASAKLFFTNKRHLWFLAVLLLLNFTLATGQNKKPGETISKEDSLKTLLKTRRTDTVYVKTILSLARILCSHNENDQSLAYADTARKLSLRLNYKPGISATDNIAGNCYFNKGELKTALKFHEKSLFTNKEINNLSGQGADYKNIGVVFTELGDLKKADSCLKISLQIREKINDKKGIANTNYELGLLNGRIGFMSLAMEYDLKALKVYEELKDQRRMAIALNGIGVLLMTNQNYKEAQSYFLRANKLYLETGDSNSTAVTIANIGQNYFYQKKYSEAIQNTNEAIRIYSKTENRNGNALCYTMLGLIYTDIKQLEKAIEYQEKARSLFLETGDKKEFAATTLNLGNIFLLQKNYAKSRTYLENGLKEVKEIGTLVYLRSAYRHLSNLSEATGDQKNALRYMKLFILYRDSITNEESTKKIIQSQMHYEFSKRSAADSIKNSEAKKLEDIKHAQEIAKQQTFTYGGIAGFLLMIVIAIISLNAFRNKKKAAKIIQHQKAIVDEKQKAILDSIHYAKRIQNVLLASENYIRNNLKRLNVK